MAWNYTLSQQTGTSHFTLSVQDTDGFGFLPQQREISFADIKSTGMKVSTSVTYFDDTDAASFLSAELSSYFDADQIALNPEITLDLSGLEHDNLRLHIKHYSAHVRADKDSQAVDGITETMLGSHISTIIGTRNYDNIIGSALDETIIGGAGNDYLQGNSGDDILMGGDGNDTLHGGDGIWGDVLSGGNHNDTLYGGDGSDILAGDGGVDILQGDGGTDIFILQFGQGADTVNDFSVVQGDKLQVDTEFGTEQTLAGLGLTVTSGLTGAQLIHNGEVAMILTGIADGDITDARFDTYFDVI